MINSDEFAAATRRLVEGSLREAIGYTIERVIPYYQGILGYLLEVPMMWIRYSRFPILFIAYDQRILTFCPT